MTISSTRLKSTSRSSSSAVQARAATACTSARRRSVVAGVAAGVADDEPYS